jgi:hypothetical protein
MGISSLRRGSGRRFAALALLAALLPPITFVTSSTGAAADAPSSKAGGTSTTVEVYDSFSKAGGYTMSDYAAKWSNGFGLGEMALQDTRNFKGGSFNVSAVPFRTGADFSVFDHLKYIALSTRSFPVPASGSVTFSSTIRVATPGTQPGRVVHGTYIQSGAPYAEPTLEGQQAGAVMNMVDFVTGQLFDWFVSGGTAFALIERLPSNVTGNATGPEDPNYVGREKMYTQIITEVPASPGTHEVSITYSRADGGTVDFSFDARRVAHVERVGVPLDVQGVPYTGIYPSLGPGEPLGAKINSFSIGHGLFSLLDAFPFQHPESPELAVSIPLSERLFGQGANATFDDFKVKTITNK